MKLRIRKNDILLLFFAYYSILRLISLIIPTEIRPLVIIIMLGSIYAPLIYFSRTKTKLDPYILLMFVGIYIIFVRVIHPEYQAVMSDEINGIWKHVITFNSGVFGYFIIRIGWFDNYDEIEDFIKKLAILILIGNVWRPIEPYIYGSWLSNMETGTTSTHNLNFGYEMALGFIIVMYYFLKNKKWYLLICLLLTGAEIMIYGGRGAILVILIFFALYELFVEKILTKGKKMVFLFILFAIILAFLYSDIPLQIVSYLDRRGISSRSFALLLHGHRINDSGRYQIWKDAIKLIKERPLFGYGIYGDQYYLNGQWCHNLFLEVLFDFGIIFGVPILVFICHTVIYMLRRCKDSRVLLLFIICCSMYLGELMVTSSFWFNTYFWVSIGIYVSYRAAEKSIFNLEIIKD